MDIYGRLLREGHHGHLDSASQLAGNCLAGSSVNRQRYHSHFAEGGSVSRHVQTNVTPLHTMY